MKHRFNYSREFKDQVLQYILDGHTIKEAARKFGISTSTIVLWKRYNNIQKIHLLGTKDRKIDSDLLREFLFENPQATVAEIAEFFECSLSTVNIALRENKWSKGSGKSKICSWEQHKIEIKGFSDEFKMKVGEFLQTGKLSPEIICKEINISLSTLVSWMKELEKKGLIEPGSFTSKTAIKLYLDDHPETTISEMAKELGLSYQCVYTSLRKLGYNTNNIYNGRIVRSND